MRDEGDWETGRRGDYALPVSPSPRLPVAQSFLQQRFNIPDRRSQGFSAMAAGRFLLGREFGESATEFGVDEDRVVAEAACSARRKGDFTLASAFESLSDLRSYRRVNQLSIWLSIWLSLRMPDM